MHISDSFAIFNMQIDLYLYLDLASSLHRTQRDESVKALGAT